MHEHVWHTSLFWVENIWDLKTLSHNYLDGFNFIIEWSPIVDSQQLFTNLIGAMVRVPNLA